MLRVLMSVASLALLATAQTEDRVVRVRSLQPFLQPSLQSGRVIDSALPDEELQTVRDATIRNGNKSKTSWVLELLKDRHATNIKDGKLVLEADANARLALHGEKGAVNSCLADLDSMAATLTRSIEISVYSLPAQRTLPPAFITGDLLQKMLDATPPTWSARAVTRPGGSVKLGDARWTHYLRDHDAEVAEDSKIFDPKVDAIFQGLRVGATAHALPNDEILLHGSWLSSQNIDVTQASIGEDKPALDLPHNRTMHITFGGKVTNGDGLVVAGRRQDKQNTSFLYIIRARYLSRPAPRSNDLFVFPATAWSDATRTSWRLQAGWFVGLDGDSHPTLDEMPVLSPSNLASFLKPRDDGSAEMHGSTLIVRDDAGACANAESALQQLVDAQLHQAELRVTQTARGARLATMFVQPVLANMQAEVFVGTERALLADHEVEIAQEANITNPIVQIARAGVWSRVTGHVMERNWNVEGIWRTVSQRPALWRTQPQKPSLNIQMADYDTSTWSWDGPMPLGESQALSPYFSVELKTK